jgi:DNA-binding HxlR family transcriptional regulator
MAVKIDMACSIARSLDVLGERWTFLILREAAFSGTTRFSDFRKDLGIAPDVLTERLATLVDHGVMEKVPYREPGSRARDAYVLTDAGRELNIVLGAMQQWGDKNLPWPGGPTVLRRLGESDEQVRVAFVDADGKEVDSDAVSMVRSDLEDDAVVDGH